MNDIHYFFAPQSPYVYLGHERFVQIAQQHGATVRLKPVDLGQVFPVSGGLPLPKRAPQRQAYRLMELRRWADHLGLTLHLQPLYFPVPADEAARLLIAVDRADGTAAALDLQARIGRAVWAEERDIANAITLAAILAEAGLPADRLDEARDPAVQASYQGHTDEAITAGVFGAPSYVVDGEIFWGQDRLDFLARRLQATPTPPAQG
jgi:carboxymethylenebutenolidase